MSVPLDARITPAGSIVVTSAAGDDAIVAAFHESTSAGLLHLVGPALQTVLPAPLGFFREFIRPLIAAHCQQSGEARDVPAINSPGAETLSFEAMRAPPMIGLEYLTADALREWWIDLDGLLRKRIAAHAAGSGDFFRSLNPVWHAVGRVTFHLAENKRDPEHPFAFMATYVHRVSQQAKPVHVPLGRAMQEYAGAQNRAALLKLLTPIHAAAEKNAWAKKLVESNQVYQPLAWTPRQTHEFLQQIPDLESAGLSVRVPDWWRAKRPAKPQVSVTIGQKKPATVGVDALLDFDVDVTLEGASLTQEELDQIFASNEGLVSLRGQWVEVDRDKLKAALEQWKRVERSAEDGVSFIEGMRLLAGAPIEGDSAAAAVVNDVTWTGITAGPWLDEALAEMRNPQAADPTPPGLNATLRPYQRDGVHWLRFMTRLGLGACLADDMGLGKTIQVISLLLHLKNGITDPALLVVPASLIPNWRSEFERFAPQLSIAVAHPSEPGFNPEDATAFKGRDVIVTTYGMLTRTAAIREATWRLVVLDEAQAIKNAGTRQTQAVKALKSKTRIALTGTPVENRVSDLWSLFDFLNPGLLGHAKAFGSYIKQLNQADTPDAYAPLRTLVRPYILRRLKTDKSIISDLPDKTEVKAFCTLTREQAKLYQQSVEELARLLEISDGIQRRGIVLSFLQRFKQICNHPAQWLGDSDFAHARSGKFERLSALCAELAERQERALVFAQFREIAPALHDYLASLFGREGLVLHGGTSIPQRKKMVEAFQQEDGPPFFVLSIKAGGTGLNLTAASHVIHFDRWWNPAVENQATDRAFRIGQKRNVLVHKFVCQGTIEEKIDRMIEEKVGLSNQLLGSGGADALLTEMSDRELMNLVALDINHAVEP